MMLVNIVNAHPKRTIPQTRIQHLARRVLRGEGITSAECSIVFIDDRRMKPLNGTYLDHWTTTDVLTFPLSEKKARTLEGEIYVNIDQAVRQARDYHVTIQQEISRLAIHGILHLVGYDDKNVRQRRSMTRREDFYLEPKTIKRNLK